MEQERENMSYILVEETTLEQREGLPSDMENSHWVRSKERGMEVWNGGQSSIIVLWPELEQRCLLEILLIFILLGDL